MKYVFFISEASSKYQMHLYRDYEARKDCVFVSPWGSSCILSKFIRRIIRLIDSLFKTSLIKKINSCRYSFNKSEKYCVIVETGYLMTCRELFLAKIIGYPNIFVCLNLIDSIHASSPSLISVKSLVFSTPWNMVISSDKGDCDEFGWFYPGVMYSSLPPKKNRNIKYDAYYIGGLKGNRENTIVKVFNKLNSNGVSCHFDLWCHSNEQYDNRIISNSLNYRKRFLKYSKVIKRIQESNCIIEIIQEGQNNQTLRWFEALYYNKKLLSNNPNIVKLPYYNPKYMHIISDKIDIDTNWVKTREDIDYGYNLDFSPIRKISLINEEMRKQEFI